jgi:hypothetical protein
MAQTVEAIEALVFDLSNSLPNGSEFAAVPRDQLADGVWGSSRLLLGAYARWSLSGGV